MALVLSALCDEAATALAWFPLMLVPQVVFGGFLFPSGETRPFTVNRDTGQVIEMPAALVRSPVRSGVLRLAGAVSVSRWALEGYAAQVYGQDLSDPDALREAVQVNFFVPLTLGDVAVGDRLVEHFRALGRGLRGPPPSLDVPSGRTSFSSYSSSRLKARCSSSSCRYVTRAAHDAATRERNLTHGRQPAGDGGSERT